MPEALQRSLYREDYYAWTREQARKLCELASTGADASIDLVNLAEEIEGLGRSDLAAARSQARRIIEHLLELEFSPSIEPRLGWEGSAVDARAIQADLQTATLRCEIELGLAGSYRLARREAELALRRPGEREAARTLPPKCPYRLEQVLAEDWYSPKRHGLIDDDGE